jgi:hypothetical protein
MTNAWYKRYDIVNNQYYQVPSWIKADFSDILAREIVLQSGDRLDIIAQQVYGDASYWRAIAIYNNIGDFFEKQPGESLWLPLNIKDVMKRI